MFELTSTALAEVAETVIPTLERTKLQPRHTPHISIHFSLVDTCKLRAMKYSYTTHF